MFEFSFSVKAWRQQQRLKNLGMPHFVASGSFIDINTGIKYRFLVLPRYDIDLQKVISKTKILDPKNVLIIAIQVLDILEYFHSQGYTHSDIKSSNLMLGFDGYKFKAQERSSFQKNTKSPVTLLPKQLKKAKNNKNRSSNYYDDEDFTIGCFDNTEKSLTKMRQKINQMLTLKDRSILRNHAFNLRQLNNVNYEDINSLCSDWSYQKDVKIHDDFTDHKDLNEIFKEAIISQSKGQVYLLDYGLASKFLDSDGNHKVFCMDARKAHDGTLEYSSRDSHIGAHSRRSDLETLGFNLLDWLTGILPWKASEVLAKPDLVHALKTNFMNDIKLLLRTCFKTEFYPQYMENFLQYITALEFAEKPDYEYCRSLFINELVKSGHIFDKEYIINFEDGPKLPFKRKCYAKQLTKKNTPRDFSALNGVKKPSQRNHLILSMENAIKFDFLKHLNVSSDEQRKQYFSKNFFTSDADLSARLKNSLMPHLLGKKLLPKNLHSKKITIAKRQNIKRHRNSIGKFGNFMGSERQFTWAEVLARNPEDIIRKERYMQTEEFDDDSACKYRIRKLSSSSDNSDYHSPLLQNDYLEGRNPTYAMKEVIANLKKKVAAKNKRTDENNIKGNLRGKCVSLEKLETIPESSISKCCTRSMYRKTLVQEQSNKKAIPVKKNLGNSKSNGQKMQTKTQKNLKAKVEIGYDNQTQVNSGKIKKNFQKHNEAEKNLEEDHKETSIKLLRKCLPRACKVRKDSKSEHKISLNNTKITLQDSEEMQKSLQLVVTKLDPKDKKQSSIKCKKCKYLYSNIC